MSTPTAPSASVSRVTAALIEASSLTSSASVVAPLSASAAIDSGRRAVAYTVWPSPSSRSAVAYPMPDEQPVIRTGPEAMCAASVARAVAPWRPALVSPLTPHVAHSPVPTRAS